MSLVRGIFGVLGAIVLMMALALLAFVLWRTHPQFSIGWFLAAAGVLYTMGILAFLHR